MTRILLILFVVAVMAACASISGTELRAPRQQVGKWELGVGISDTYGLWSPSIHGDGSADSPYDTTWTSITLHPEAIAQNDTFLIVRNKSGKYLLTAKTSDGKDLWKSTHSEKRYLQLRHELGIPDSLVLRSIP